MSRLGSSPRPSYLFAALLIAATAAFQVRSPPPRSSRASTISDVAELAPRDVSSLGDWAAVVGIEISDGFVLVASGDDGEDCLDVCAATYEDLPAGSPVLFVPAGSMMTGSAARREIGDDAAHLAEASLADGGGEEDASYSSLMQFHLFVKVIREYELGESSPWRGWLESLPRYHSNGASMTDFCFGCLPPYAAGLSLGDKRRLGRFARALVEIPSVVSYEGRNDPALISWAYAIVRTRCLETPDGSDACLAPMADYFNHGGGPDNHAVNVDVSFDGYGNCIAHANRDVAPGEHLRTCYGDPTNPSELLARYGFLDESSPATFCKIVIDDPSPELVDLGCHPSRMLFYRDGGVSQEVWDVMCYQELGKVSREAQLSFYLAHATGDVSTKGGYRERCFPATLSALVAHVDRLLDELEELALGLEIQRGQGRDAALHPRLSLVMRHNEFVRDTLEAVQRNLDITSC
jgi:hypothetical protein